MELKIEYVPIDTIRTYENNAKIHTAEQIEQIKKSIQDFGMNDPIALWHDTIVEGHGRLIACMELGYDEMPVIRLDHLTDEERRAYMLVHNQLTMNTGFNFEVLQEELENITNFNMEDYGFELNISDDISDDLPAEAKYNEKISIVIDCKDEEEAEKIYNKLTSEGYECRISTL